MKKKININNYNIKGLKISVDFDNTLSRKDVQEYISELLSLGVEVYVTTARYDDLNAYKYTNNPGNEDLWNILKKLNIDFKKVRFTLMEYKINYLQGTPIVWHLDDLYEEYFKFKYSKNKTFKMIIVNTSNWKFKCSRLLIEKSLENGRKSLSS